MNKSLVIDVDGHILEPSDLWVKNIEPECRDMALHMGVGEDGLEQWFSEGKGGQIPQQGHQRQHGYGKQDSRMATEEYFRKSVGYLGAGPRDESRGL